MSALALLEPWQALLLGVVEGVTEFLPVSSTGHLLLAQRALGLARSPALDAFVVVVQVGAILAVLGLYRARAAQMLRGLLGRDPAGLRLLARLAVAFLPAAVVGLLVERHVERYLFGLWPITAAWAGGGLLLLALGRRRRASDGAGDGSGAGAEPAGGARGRGLETLSLRGALIVGLFQCAALIPGTSRSLASLAGGIVAGLSLAAAVEFSFLLGVVTLSAAAAWKAITHGPAMLEGLGASALLLGSLAAALAALASVAFLATWVRRHGLVLFGWYRLALAALVAGLLLSGTLASG